MSDNGYHRNVGKGKSGVAVRTVGIKAKEDSEQEDQLSPDIVKDINENILKEVN